MRDEGCCGGALLYVVEAEDVRRERRVSHVEADADRRVVYRPDLPARLRGPHGVVVDLAADDGQLGVVVLHGYRHAKHRGPVYVLAQGGTLGPVVPKPGERLATSVPREFSGG